jgi:hypothetical protein
VTGFLADSRRSLVEAVKAAQGLDRAACRRHVEARFSVDTMTRHYEDLYVRLAQRHQARLSETR